MAWVPRSMRMNGIGAVERVAALQDDERRRALDGDAAALLERQVARVSFPDQQVGALQRVLDHRRRDLVAIEGAHRDAGVAQLADGGARDGLAEREDLVGVGQEDDAAGVARRRACSWRARVALPRAASSATKRPTA